jgi:hypothetical protein
MTAVSLAAGHTQPPGSGDPPGGPPQTLADEHMLLLGQVAVRAGELLAAAARGRWPAAELAALTGYIRAEVLRQVADEEMLLFPPPLPLPPPWPATMPGSAPAPTSSSGWPRGNRAWPPASLPSLPVISSPSLNAT